MKSLFTKCLLIGMLILSFASHGTVYAVDTKLSDITNLGAAPQGTDELYLNDSLVSKALTITNLFLYLGAAYDTEAELLALFNSKQPVDADLTSIALLGTTGDRMAYTTSGNTWAEAIITATGRSILDDANVGAVRTTLGVYSTTEADAAAAAQDIALDYTGGDIASGVYNTIQIEESGVDHDALANFVAGEHVAWGTASQGTVDNTNITMAASDLSDGSNIAHINANESISGYYDFSVDIIMSERAAIGSTPGAGKGYLWVKNTDPSTLIYTDDDGTDFTLGSAGLPGDVESVGDCADGACYDGTVDGGTYMKLYDAQGATTLSVGDNAGVVALTLPITTGTMVIAAEVLTRTNVGAFTPTADYHPATKKYVDDEVIAGAVSGVGDCGGGACFDGTVDGGTNLLFYDAQGAVTVEVGDVAGAITLTLPAIATGTLYATGNTDVSLADGGTGESLTNPGADRIMFWDNDPGSVAFLTAGSGLTISTTTITADLRAVDANELEVTAGSIGLVNTATAKTALGLTIGTNVQAFDVDLTALATPTAWRMFYSDAADAPFIQEIVLGADGTFLESNGVSAAPAFRALTPADLTSVTATAAELNYTDIATLGTGENSKAVTLTAGGNFTAPAGTWDMSNVTGITLQANEIVDADVVNALTVTAQTGSTWNLTESITALSVYTGTVSLVDEGVSNSTSGAYLVKVYDEFTNSNSTNVQDVLDDLDSVITGGATVYNAIGNPTAAGTIAFTNATWTGTYTSAIDAWDGILITNTQAAITAPSELLTLTFTDTEGTSTGELNFLTMVLNTTTVVDFDEDGLKIGTGTPTNTMDGGDVYVTDDLEVDGTVTVGGLEMAGSVTPTWTFQDSDATGTSEEAAKIVANLSDVADANDEISDWRITYIHDDGVSNDNASPQASLFWDGSTHSLSMGVLTDDFVGGDVAGYESLKWNFNAGEPQIAVTSPSGATQLDFQIATVVVDALTTSGILTIGGNLVYGSADLGEAELEILDDATVSTTELNMLASKTLAGVDLTILTGTSGTTGNCAEWDASGDLIDSGGVCGGSGSGDVATDAIWDTAGDMVYGTGADTAIKLAIGTANQILQTNAGATAPEWVANTPTNITPVDTGNEDALFYLILTDGATGTQATETDGALLYNPFDKDLFLGSTTVDAGSFKIQMGAQTGDPYASFSMVADGTGNFGFATLGGTQGNISFSPSGGNIIMQGSVSVTDNIFMSNADYIGTGSGDRITFNTAGSINFSGATVDVDGAFTASTVAADTTVSGTTITASTGFALGDTDYIGIAANEIITFNAAGTIVASGAVFSSTEGYGVNAPQIATPSSWTMSGAGLYGGSYIGTGDTTANLPVVAVNMNFSARARGATTPTLEPNGTDAIFLNGTSCGDGVNIVGSGTAGDMVVMEYGGAAGDWEATANGFTCGS